MAEFTEAERAYIAKFESVKASLPHLYYSIKNLTITDKPSLLRSLLFYSAMEYGNYASLSVPKSFPQALRIWTLDKRNIAYNFYKIPPSAHIGLIDEIFELMWSYLNGFELNLGKNIEYLTDPENIQRRAQFLRHLEINRELLLQGPPHANAHTINEEKAREWVAAQKTPRRRELAEILLRNLQYIPHSKFLEALEDCVEKAHAKLVPGPVTFVVGRPSKSNYYTCLLFAHFWLQKRYPIDCVLANFQDVKTYPLTGNFLDIDDMAYSGSQTRTVLWRNFTSYADYLRTQLKETFQGDPAYNKTYMYVPRYLIEQSLQTSGFRYFVVRAFMSEKSIETLNTTDASYPRFPCDIVTHQILPYMPGVDPRVRKEIEYLFNHEVYSTVYFDHKVADMPSTFLLPIALGIVPSKMIFYMGDPKTENINTSLVNGIEGDDLEYIPFISHCGAEERELPRKTLRNIVRSEPLLEDKYRCPFAWYKLIDYDTATYPSIPLPYGPNEENFLGGKRKTRKQVSKRQSKRKTRSHSK